MMRRSRRIRREKNKQIEEEGEVHEVEAEAEAEAVGSEVAEVGAVDEGFRMLCCGGKGFAGSED